MSWNTCADAAIAYAETGLFVFPLDPGAKKPAIVRWKEAATKDPTRVQELWAMCPDYGVGILTGQRTQIAVLDVDPRNKGDASLAHLIAEHGELPHTVEAMTGGGGQHYYFRILPGAHDHVSDRNGLAGYEGLDLKCGGFVVGPPSIHPLGERYRWAAGRAPGEIDMAVMPAALAELCKRTPAKRAPSIKSSGGVAEGSRDDFLFRLGCQWRAKGLGETEVAGALAAINRERCNPPLDDDEVRRIAASVMRYDPNAGYETTDLGNARRLVAEHGEDLRFETVSRRWMVWCGTHWREDSDGEVMRRAKACVEAMLSEAELLNNRGHA